MPTITTRLGGTVVNAGGAQLFGPAWMTGNLSYLLPGDKPTEPVLPTPEQNSLDAQAAQDKGNAEAEAAKAAGLAKEADAYRMAAGIAGSSASLEDQATAITRFQQQRQVRATVAGQRADVAAAGFKESGSALSLLRESISQGAITDALTMVQGNISKNGYLAQQAAAVGEQQSALASSAAALALSKSYADAGVLATSLSANVAAAQKASDSLQLFGPGSFGGGGAGGGGVNVRGGGGSDPFLEGTLVNPAYTGTGGGVSPGGGVAPGGSGFNIDTTGQGSGAGGGGSGGTGTDFDGGGSAGTDYGGTG